MKRILLLTLSLLTLLGCSKFDDSEIWEKINNHEDRITRLETLCNQMNTNITSLQTIIIALQSNDYVVNIAPIMEGNKEIGYTITFAKSGSITIYHGKNGKDGANGADGKDGQNGTDGKDGKDGYTPKIGIKQHTDGRYYWTLDGTWLLDDNGNMIPATGKDGEDGQDGANGSDGKDGQDGENGKDGTNGKDGKDGVTPQLKIEDGYWYLSYDNGSTWQKLGKATGNNGLNGANGADGEDGDSIIQSITQDDEYVYFNLMDETLITLPKRNVDVIVFEDLNVKAICCKNWDSNEDGELSYSEASSVTRIGETFKGTTIIAFNEFKFFTSLTCIPDNAFQGCTNLWKIILPPNILSIGRYAFSECTSLKRIDFPNKLESIGYDAFRRNTSLTKIIIPDSVKSIEFGAFGGCESIRYIYVGTGITEVVSGAFDTINKTSSSKSIDGEFIYNSIIPDAHYSSPSYYGILKDVAFKKITVGGNATRIGRYAFCYSEDGNHGSLVETLVIEESIKDIGTKAAYTKTLKEVYCKSPIPPSGTSDMFWPSISKIYIPIGSIERYKSAYGWISYSDKFEEYDFSNNI